MTKKEAIQRKADWAKALAEGRVVRFGSDRLTSYPTVARAEVAVRDARAFTGKWAEIVVVTP